MKTFCYISNVSHNYIYVKIYFNLEKLGQLLLSVLSLSQKDIKAALQFRWFWQAVRVTFEHQKKLCIGWSI